MLPKSAHNVKLILFCFLFRGGGVEGSCRTKNIWLVNEKIWVSLKHLHNNIWLLSFVTKTNESSFFFFFKAL